MTDTIADAPSVAIERSTRDELVTRPIFYDVDPDRLALIKSQVAANTNDTEIAHFLELCSAYDLDPFAREAWCAKSARGKLLIMVGRDGLRKIAQRNGLHVDGDVVRENDDFSVVRTPDGNRVIAHSYGNPSKRGDIIGAWAEVREGGPLGKPMGYFYAPLEEYLPKRIDEYSPWGKQVGVMNLAAAERQAIRQATPLGGLLAEGENESMATPFASPTEAAAPVERTEDLPPDLDDLLVRAAAVDAGVWRANEVAARLPDPGDDGYGMAVELLSTELLLWLTEHEPQDAVEVVDAEPAEDPAGVESIDAYAAAAKRWRDDPEWRERVEPLMHRFADLELLVDDANAAGDVDRGADAVAELDALTSELDSLEVPGGWLPADDTES